jgi:hypothetical protein
MKMNNIKTKEQARTKAIDWQRWMTKQSLSYGEMAQWQGYFEKLAKRFNLLNEFRENGIL